MTEEQGAGEVDYLDTAQAETAEASGRRWGPIIGLTIGGLVVAGGAAYGVAQFLSGGQSPAGAVPDDVFAYLAVDLDPGAGQQVEAYRTLKKFPGIKDELGLTGDQDLRKAIFDKIVAESGCDISYRDDIDPWLGNSAAVTGWSYQDAPELAVAVAVKDQSKAEAGLKTLQDCEATGGDSGSESGSEASAASAGPGVAFSDGWMVLADDEKTAQAFVDAAAASSLADNDDFRSRVDAVGGEGFVTGYVAAGAVDQMLSGMTRSGTDAMSSGTGSAGTTELGVSPIDPVGGARDQLEQYLGDFKGAAMSVRFNSESLDVRVQGEGLTGLVGTTSGDSGVEDLPAGTAVAFGLPIGDGYVSDLLDQMKKAVGESTYEQGVTRFEGQTGLRVPQDVQTLLGDGVSFALDSSFDPSTVSGGSPDQLARVPAGLRINGDPAKVRPVLDKVLGLLPLPPGLLAVAEGDDAVALAFDPAYAEKLTGSGGLGDDDGFTEVLPDVESGDVALYADANGGWLTGLLASDGSPRADQVAANVEPLDTVGLSVGNRDGTYDMRLRVTTD